MRIQTASDVGLLIRDRRQALGWDQQTLADHAGVGRQWVVAIEKGKPRAALGLVLRTLAALKVRIMVDDGTATPASSRVTDLDAIIQRTRQQPPALVTAPRRRRPRS